MITIYVATTGSDNAAGTEAAPLRTIAAGLAKARPGDEVVVKAGTYQERVWIDKGGSAAADIVIRSEVPGGAKIISPAGNYSTVNIRANYVTLDGFDVKGGTGHAFDADHVHHISVLNSVAHDSGGSGIGFAWTDFVTIEGNIAYNNAKTNGYHTSGISIYQAENLTGDTSSSGFRNVIRNNITYNNNESNVGGEHTDGNGIIIDDFQSTQNSGRSGYKFSTLVENNLSYNNGGKGIAVHWSDNVTVRNNTVWHNNLDNGNPGTWRGEISNQSSVNNTFVNNIMVADPKANSYNTAIGDYGTENKNNKWLNNITFNGTTGQASVRLDGGNPAPTTANGNLLGVDPQLIDFTPTNPALAGIGWRSTGYVPEPLPEPEPETPQTSPFAAKAPSLIETEDQAYELGTKVKITRKGTIKALRVYRTNSTSQPVRVWKDGAAIVTGSLPGGANGWVEVAVDLAVEVGDELIVSVGKSVSQKYPCEVGALAADVAADGYLILANGGLFSTTRGSLPTQTWNASYYWTDIRLVADYEAIIADLEAQLAAKTAAVSELEETVSDLMAIVADLETRLADKAAEALELEEMVNNLNEQLQYKEIQIVDLEIRLDAFDIWLENAPR